MIKYVDIPSIMQVIGGVYVDNSLLDNDSYHFSEDDFTEEFHKILFGSIYNIHLMGTEKVNIDTIEHYLSQRPKAYGVYNANHGREYIQKLAEITQIATFDYYYKRMKKMTLFRQYSKIGVDVSWLYNPDDVLNVKKKQSQEDWLDNTSIEEIAELINDKIEAIKSKYADGEKDNLQQAGEDIENFLEDLKQNPEYGYPLYGDYINTITRGARLGKLYLRSASTGLGKALDNETLLPTPIGYRKVKDIKVGDYLFDAEGLPTKVLRVFPQPEKKQVYVVHLADGREVRCCGDHLWRIEDAFNKVFRIKSTKEIYEKELKSATPYHYSNGRRKILIPMNKPVVYPEKKLSTNIAEIVKKVKNELTEIPEEIAFNSIEIREEFAKLFLNGMNKINFPNEEIAYSLVSLMRSLGRQVEIQERFDEENERIYYFVYINPKIFKRVSIINIEVLDEFVDMTCFTVDNDDALFLCGDYVVTHNTRMMIADACNFACKKIYDIEQQEWIEKNYQVPTLFIATEQDLREIQTMMVAFVADVDEEHILTGKYAEGEWERAQEAAKIIKDSPLYIEELPDFSMQDIERIIKRTIHEHHIKAVCFDYLHSSMKILGEISSKTGVKGLREDNVLFMISVKLKDLANQYKVFIITSTQLNGSYEDGKLDQNALRGAKSIADKADFGALLVKATKQDLECLQTILDYGFPTPDIKMSIYKNRRGRYKDVILWCRSRRESCRIIPMFMTGMNYEFINIQDTKINIKAEDI